MELGRRPVRRYSEKVSTVLRLCQIKVIREQFESHLAKQTLLLEIEQLRETYTESVQQLKDAEKLTEQLTEERTDLLADKRVLSKKDREVTEELREVRKLAEWFTQERRIVQDKLREVAAEATRERLRNARTKEQLEDEQRKGAELEGFIKAGPHSFKDLGIVLSEDMSMSDQCPLTDDMKDAHDTWTEVWKLIIRRQAELETNVRLYETLQGVISECRRICTQLDEEAYERRKKEAVLLKKKAFLESKLQRDRYDEQAELM